MKISVIIILLIGVFIPNMLRSQTTITGKVTSILEPVTNASILLRENNIIITYSISDSLGNFKLHFDEKITDSLILEVNSLSHETGFFSLNESQTFYSIELKEREHTLDEVFITNKKIINRKDTVYYNIEMFKNGTEEYVEDLLKKLPGIIIENDGTIKYNNKKIKKLLLDGDDLFGSKYKIGSKNIDANMVDSVQVYKKFSQNALLKNIEDSEEVAINLSLKKGKTDISGNARLGYGYKDRKDIHTTAFLLKSKFKAFSVVSFNNVGIDKSPFVTTSNNTNYLISRGNFGSELDKKYHLINNSLYTNASFLHRFSDHLKINANLNHLNDRLNRNSTRNLTYLTPATTFSVNEKNKMESKPVLYDSDILLDYHRKDLMFKYQGRIFLMDESFQNTSLNNFYLQETDLTTKDFSSIQDGELTYKINDSKVIVNKTNYTFIKSTQDFKLSPGYVPSETVNTNFQQSNFSQELLSNKLKLYQNFSRLKAETAVALKLEENKFTSLLLAENELVSNYANDLTQRRFAVEFFNSFIYQINLRNKLKLNFSLVAGKEEFNKLLGNQNLLLLNYDIDYNITVSKKSTISFFQSLKQETPNLSNLFDGRVISSYRSIIENVPNFKKIQISAIGFSYNYDDYINLTKLFFTFNYQHHNNGFYFQNHVDSNKTIIRSFLLNKDRDSYNLLLSAEKFINKIRTTFSSTITLNFDENYNYVNDSELRNIENKSMQINLKARTDLTEDKLSFENSFNYFRQEVLIPQQYKSSFDKIFYTFKLNYQPFKKPIYISSEIDFYHPDLSSNDNYFFNNYDFSYKPQTQKFEFSLKINNITNTQQFRNTFVSDFYYSQYTYDLVGRNVLLAIKYKF